MRESECGEVERMLRVEGSGCRIEGCGLDVEGSGLMV